MSAMLPKNLSLVGDDLARATLRDARRSAKRRRAVVATLVLALLALTATTAIANGWLFGSAPTLSAAPGLLASPAPAQVPGGVISAAAEIAQGTASHSAAFPASPQLAEGTVRPDAAGVLMSGLGTDNRTLSVVPTSTGGVCFTLTGLPPQCESTFPAGQAIIWDIESPPSGPTIVWGIARDEVASIAAVSADGVITPAQLSNDGFYLELADGPPTRLITQLTDGRTDSVPIAPCPLTTPNCAH